MPGGNNSLWIWRFLPVISWSHCHPVYSSCLSSVQFTVPASQVYSICFTILLASFDAVTANTVLHLKRIFGSSAHWYLWIFDSSAHWYLGYSTLPHTDILDIRLFRPLISLDIWLCRPLISWIFDSLTHWYIRIFDSSSHWYLGYSTLSPTDILDIRLFRPLISWIFDSSAHWCLGYSTFPPTDILDIWLFRPLISWIFDSSAHWYLGYLTLPPTDILDIRLFRLPISFGPVSCSGISEHLEQDLMLTQISACTGGYTLHLLLTSESSRNWFVTQNKVTLHIHINCPSEYFPWAVTRFWWGS
jgi:hypothetical protein